MIPIDGRSLTPEAVHAVAHGAPVHLPDATRARLARTAAAWPADDVLVGKGRQIVGAAVGLDPAQFVLGHCTAVGEPLPAPLVRALIACRANVLAGGASAVRPEAVDALLDLLRRGVTPVVPQQGSVGAAGDLAPLAHVARVACGLGGAAMLPDGTVVDRVEVPPFRPTAKEALALINGATLTVALAAVAVVRARRLLDAVEVACTMTFEALHADVRALSPAGLAARGHPEAEAVAARMRGWLAGSARVRRGPPADPFSLRAAPAVLGAARAALEHAEAVVTRELNGACDNPLWFDTEGVVETGNFHGAPVALVLDYLRAAMVAVATQSERRTFRLSTGHLVGDLPSFLVEDSGLNSGLMLAQYTAASLASECKGLAHPASVDSIPTVQHSEDHVSMGPIAGRLTLRVLEALADIVGIEALFAAQALDFRDEGVRFEDGVRRQGPPLPGAPAVARAHAAVRAVVPRWREDEVMHPRIRAAGALVRAGGLVADPPQTTPAPW